MDTSNRNSTHHERKWYCTEYHMNVCHCCTESKQFTVQLVITQVNDLVKHSPQLRSAWTATNNQRSEDEHPIVAS